MIGENEAKNLCDAVLKRAGDDDAEVLLLAADEYLTRFATNYIHQNVAERNITLTVRVHLGKRVGLAVTNKLDPESLDEVVVRARTSAAASPENPDHAGLAEPVEYKTVQSFDEVTATFSPADRAKPVGEICSHAKEKGLIASGAYSTGVTELALANTKGLFAYHLSTEANFSTVMMEDGGDSSGWADLAGWRVGDIQVADLGLEAVRKAEMGKDARKIEPGEYPVVLDPYAVQDIIMSLNVYGIGALSVQEGRSWMVNRIGQKVFDEKISLWDDPFDPSGVPIPFDFEGTPKKRVDIIKDGVVIGPVYNRAAAQKEGKQSTGHGLPWNITFFGPVAFNMFMAPGDSTVDEMITSTERGLYITRFHYTRLVHPSECVMTGMTRDGVYMIENGKIVYPVKNLRFTQSYVQALANVEAVGKETHLLQSFGAISAKVPALKLKSFNFTGSTV